MAVIDLKHDDGQQSVPLQRYEEDKYSQALEGHIDGNHTKTECTSSTNTTTGMVLMIPMFDRIRLAATSFYRFITHLLCEHFCHGKEKARVCHIWPGKNVFFFKGYLVCGPDPRALLVTAISIVFATWVFCEYVANGLSNHSHNLIVIFSIVLTTNELFSLFMVSTRDPGIVPRLQVEHQIGEVALRSRIKSKSVVVNGVEIRIKFCRICKQFRPPRSSHCATCDNCVEKFDHHCPFIGHCIGLRNYRYYLLFISSSLALSTYIFAFSCLKLWKKISTGFGFLKVIANVPETVILMLLSFFAIFFLGGLVVYHAYLIMLNQTAYENYMRSEMATTNPYDKGILSNIKETLFAKLPPARVNFRAEIAVSQQTDIVRLEKKTSESTSIQF